MNYKDIGYALAYENISDNKTIEICNEILRDSLEENDEEVLESMFKAVYLAVTYHRIASKININMILPSTEKFNRRIAELFIKIIAESGKARYLDVIEKLGWQKYRMDLSQIYCRLFVRSIEEEDEDLDYDNVGNILEYANISEDEAVDLSNRILTTSLKETDKGRLETMYSAVYLGVVNRDIADRIDFDIVLPEAEKLDRNTSEYLFLMLPYTGKKKYLEVLKKINEKYRDFDMGEAVDTLNETFEQKRPNDKKEL